MSLLVRKKQKVFFAMIQWCDCEKKNMMELIESFIVQSVFALCWNTKSFALFTQLVFSWCYKNTKKQTKHRILTQSKNGIISTTLFYYLYENCGKLGGRFHKKL